MHEKANHMQNTQLSPAEIGHPEDSHPNQMLVVETTNFCSGLVYNNK